jgi:DHA3 family macrolide efflux protein-like MFS transporter
MVYDVSSDAKSQDDPTRTPPLKSFFVIWTGQAFSLVGSQLVQFALVWWLTKTTGSATVLAFATMMALLPQIVLGPIAGALVDRWNRRRVLILADGGIALPTLLLALLYAADLAEVWHVYVLMLVRSTGAAFHWPAMQASTTLMVPERHLSRVAGLNQTIAGAANIGAPPLGALLLELLPMQGILAVDVVTAGIAIAPLLFITVPQPKRLDIVTGAGIVAPVVNDLRAGLRLVWDLPGILLTILIAMLLNLLGTPALSLLPIMVSRHFGGGAIEFAWLESAWGVGMVLGGLTLGVWGGSKRRMATAMAALALQGLGLIAVGVTPATAFLLALAAIFFTGLMNPVINGSLYATVQVVVDPQMQGRVFTLLRSGALAMTPLGLALAGPLADLLSVQAWLLIAGVATSAMGLGAFSIPAIMRIEDRQTQTAPTR